MEKFPLSFLAVVTVLTIYLPDAIAEKGAPETSLAGWEDLTPAPSLEHWFRVPIPANAKLGRAQWHVEGDTLVCDGDGGHEMLLLDRQLGDGIFHVEFRFKPFPDGKGYNSGVFVRTSRDGSIWHQAQIGSASGGYFFGVTPKTGGTKEFNVGEKLSRVKEAGEWNTFEITTHGPSLVLTVNGFRGAELPDCGLASGYFGLESEGYAIEFRNLRFKPWP